MRRYWQALLSLARNLSVYRNPGEWTLDDTRVLNAFLAGNPTGAKLKQHLLNLTLEQNASAVLQHPSLTYRCGYASGFRAAVGVIDSLSMPAPSEEVEPDSSTDLEHLSL